MSSFMQIKSFFKKLCLSWFLFATSNVFAVPLYWQTLAPGLEYTQLNPYSDLSIRNLYAFRFDLTKYQLELAFTQNQNNTLATVASLVVTHGAVLGVNGGFFSPDFKPLGLRINNGQIKNPLKPIDWWGVFFTRNDKAFIVPQRAYRSDASIDFAVQSGPRLIVNGKIPPLKPGAANRTALGITRSGEVILLATDNMPLSTTELAVIMQRSPQQGGLGCVNALNLDGGSSTQLYANLDDFHLQVLSFFPVTDAVLVVPKNKV